MDKLKIEYIDINSIKPYSKNAKRHPKKQIEQLKNGKATPKGESVENAIKRNEKLLEAQKLVRKLRLDIYNR